MFTNRAFKSWPQVVVGALLFGALFMLVAMMADLVLDGTFRPTQGAMALGLAAVVGYIGVALLLRSEGDHPACW